MNEQDKLRASLDEMGAKWEDLTDWTQHPPKRRTLYLGRRGMVAAICGEGTEGGVLDLLEAWNPGEGHVGWLLAEEVVEMFPPMVRR